MRLLVDLLPCQTTSRLRGIGRYALALTQALVRTNGGHQFHSLADAQYGKSCDELRTMLSPMLETGHFASYRHSGVSASMDERLAASLVTGAYRVLSPDAVLCLSPFEGWAENGVAPDPGIRVGASLRAAVLYDLIPWLFPSQYLDASPTFKKWYTARLQHLKRFDLLLAISEATRRDAIEHLGIEPGRIAVIGGAVDERFRPLAKGGTPGDVSRFGIQRPFVLYTGNADYRKNLSGMVRAYARMPEALRRTHQLVVNQTGDRREFWHEAKALGLRDDDIVVTGHVDDAELVALYQQCKIFVFPSLYEGFGLPVLEAMACGAPVIAADNSSIPEVVGRADVLFDAKDPEAIAVTLSRVLSDEGLQQELRTFGIARAAEFSWDATGMKAWQAIEHAKEMPRVREQCSARGVGDTRPAVSIVSADAGCSGSDEPGEGSQLAVQLSAFANVEVQAAQPGHSLSIHAGSAEGTAFDGALRSGTVVYSSQDSAPPAWLLREMRKNPGVLVLGSSGLAGACPEPGIRSLLLPPCGESDGGEPAVLDVLASTLSVVTQTEEAANQVRRLQAGGWCPPITVLDLVGGKVEGIQSLLDNASYLAPSRLVDEVAQSLEELPSDESLLDRICASAGHNLRLNRHGRLLIDVTQLAKTDARSGIQRVVRNIVRELCLGADTPPIEIVQLVNGRLVRAAGVVASVFDRKRDAYGDAAIDIHPGDVLLMLDSSWEQYEQFLPVFEEVRQFGGRIVSVVYDLIPILHPEYCSPGLVSVFKNWLRSAVMESDMLICISRAVKTTLADYLAEAKVQPPRPLLLEHWNLGADLAVLEQELSIRPAVQAMVDDVSSPLFLLVGTIEPRKGHDFVLDAFEQIWAAGGDARLCFAGKQGWHVEALVSRIRNHPMNGTKLFVIEGFTDAEINRCYESATALIAASTIEGYGLPIVEAAMHQVPVLASDIPVFREVGGEGAIYFQLGVPSSLGEAVSRITKMPEDERRALASRIRPITWRESARQLAGKLFGRPV